MNRARIDERMRQMRFEELLGRHERGELGQELAAQMLGVSDRTFRPWRDRLKDEGPAGLEDRRLPPSGKRAAHAEIEQMLGLYRDTYSDFTVKHFHEQLVKRHGCKLGCKVTKVWRQRSGLVSRAKSRWAHRKKRPRRSVIGMMLHQDGSREERRVGNDNTLRRKALSLQLPESHLRPSFLRTQVRVPDYRNGSLSVF
jgi:transposase